MQPEKTFYLTTTLPYVNAELHMGHALEFVRADVVARYKAVKGFDVFFNTGTDEHGQKIYESATNQKLSPQEFVDKSFEQFKESVAIFGLTSNVHYIRTSDAHHEKAAQEFWTRCYENGYIYKKNYQARYCVGCEEVKTDSELIDAHCPIHPNRELEILEEENYFFRYSAFTEKLQEFYKAHEHFVIPDFRYNEIKAFVDRGLEDFSISRQKAKMSWGLPVPNDPDHVMYVWFDALTNYISTLGWPDAAGDYMKYWLTGTPTQYCGKDNLRFQAAMWQAMLMAAKVPNSHQIVINGFITADGGVKMSKSLGNGVDPKAVVAEYGTDALRYFLIKEISNFEDSPFTSDRFRDAYNAGLANGLGNLCSRTLTMVMSLGGVLQKVDPVEFPYQVHGFGLTEEVGGLNISSYIAETVIPTYEAGLENFELSKSADVIWELITFMDRIIARTEPYKMLKTDPVKASAILYDIVSGLYIVTRLLDPIIPSTAEKIREHIGNYNSDRPEAFTVKKFEEPLFPRK